MSRFLVLYRAPVGAREQMAAAPPEAMKAGMDLWTTWAERAGKRLVDFGGPLAGEKHVGAGGTEAAGALDVTGYSLLEADSLDEVVDLMKDHPHHHTPGGSIEVLSVLEMPGM